MKKYISLVTMTIIFVTGLFYIKIFAQGEAVLEPNQVTQNTPSQNQEENSPDIKKEQPLKEMVDILLREKASLETRLKRLESANARLEKALKQLYVSDQDSKQIKKDRDSLAAALEALNKEKTVLKNEIEALKKDNENLQESCRKEKTQFLLKMAASYTQAKLFPQAIDAYLALLNINPVDAKPHYYLGLLYQHSQKNSHKALVHFKKYLELNPQAEDRKDVEYLIEMLKQP